MNLRATATAAAGAEAEARSAGPAAAPGRTAAVEDPTAPVAAACVAGTVKVAVAAGTGAAAVV